MFLNVRGVAGALKPSARSLDIRAPEDLFATEEQVRDRSRRPVEPQKIAPAIDALLRSWLEGDRDSAKSAADEVARQTRAHFQAQGVPVFAHPILPPQFVHHALELIDELPKSRQAAQLENLVSHFSQDLQPSVAQELNNARTNRPVQSASLLRAASDASPRGDAGMQLGVSALQSDVVRPLDNERAISTRESDLHRGRAMRGEAAAYQSAMRTTGRGTIGAPQPQTPATQRRAGARPSERDISEVRMLAGQLDINSSLEPTPVWYVRPTPDGPLTVVQGNRHSRTESSAQRGAPPAGAVFGGHGHVHKPRPRQLAEARDVALYNEAQGYPGPGDFAAVRQTGVPEVVRSRQRIFIIYLDPDGQPVAEVVAGEPFPPNVAERIENNSYMRENMRGQGWRFRNGPAPSP